MFKHGEEVWGIHNLFHDPRPYIYCRSGADDSSLVVVDNNLVSFRNDRLCHSYHQAIVAQAMLINNEIQCINNEINRLEQRYSELMKKFDSTKLTHDAEEFAKIAGL